ncbi:MAG: M28 family peptidase, partial [Chloroflexia bacterium]
MRRFLSLISLLALLLAPAGSAAAQTPAPGPATALVYVALNSPGDLARFEAAGLPAYARMIGREEEYLLAGATPGELEALSRSGLSFRILDPDTSGATYYFAFPRPGQPIPRWEEYGRLLLDDGLQVLLRISPSEAERLALAGVDVQVVTFDPKPLHPWATERAFPEVITPDPLIQQMIDQVTLATVYSYTGGLSGEWPVNIGGSPYTIATRHTYSGTPIQKATQFVGEHLQGLGLAVEYHQWGGSTYPNVIGTYTGTLNPDDIFIIGAHLDDMPSGSLAPGADDNASGSVATLIAADILTRYQWGCTLKFAFWTGEEQGLLGSHAYAQRAFSRGENILGYLNLDMIAWSTGGSSPDIDLHADSTIPPTLALAQLFADVVDAYDLNLIPQIIPNGTGASDHASFWDYGYTAILGIEDMDDFNPYYHTVNDDMDNFQDWPYYVEFVKAAIGTFAHMSGCLIPGGIGYLDGHVTAAQGGAPIAGATVRARDAAGHVLLTTTDHTGYYTRTLLAGTYVVTATAYGYLPASVSGVVVVTDTVTTLDFALQTAPTYVVSGTVTEWGTGLPLFAHITFDGSPEEAWTDPASGFYTITLPQGTYTMHVTAYGHRPAQRAIVLDHNQTQNFGLEPLPCILLVDDDNNSPDTRPYFTAALDTLGYDYDVFDVGGGSGNGPNLAGLQGYAIVIWFSGDKYGGSAGPNSTDEANLAAYLDDGGHLFLSSQDYLWDFGLTPFGQNYLGIGSFTNDNGDATSKVGVAGDPIGGGLGPYPLTYPSGFTDYGDTVNAAAPPASQAFRGGNNNRNLDVDKDGGDWRTVFFGTDWVPIYYNNATNGREVLQRIIEWFGGCRPPVLTPTLVISPEAFSVTLAAGSQHTATLTVGNVGNGMLYFTLTEAPEVSWLAEAPAGGSVNPGGNRPVAVSFDAAGLEPGPYLTTLQVHSNDPLRPLVPVAVTLTVVPGQSPQASFTSNSPVCLGEAMVFTNTTTGTPPISYEWAFGDGETSTETNPIHTYTAAATYTVVLTAVNAAGMDTYSAGVEVLLLPEAGFTYTISGLTAAFTNTSRN